MQFKNSLFISIIVLFYACDFPSNSSINTKQEWLLVKKDLDQDWKDYTNKTLGNQEAAEKFIEYANSISTSKAIPPQIRYEESIILYKEALKFVDNKKVEKKLKYLEQMYRIVNL